MLVNFIIPIFFSYQLSVISSQFFYTHKHFKLINLLLSLSKLQILMSAEEKSLNFIEQIIEDDLKNGLSSDKLRFRFPPEPNGYLHVGHASAICLNFGLGIDYKAPVNLRFDDTNPSKEEQEFVDAIKKDVEWLGFNWD